MKVIRSYPYHRRGFTVVELMVVIVVLGITASIVMLAMNGWRQRVAQTQVKNDLIAVASAMEVYRNTNGAYLTSLPSGFTASKGVTVTFASGTSTAYCINGSVEGTLLHVQSASGGTPVPQAGICP